jgi:diacylglycerol kinase
MLDPTRRMLDSSGMSDEDEPRRRQQSLLRSFRVSWDGLVEALRTDRNLRIHAAATVLVALAGLWFRLRPAEWSVLALTIGLVWVSELLNTAIEAVVDLASPEHHDLARRAKDIASAAVLVAAVAAVVVGLAIFGPRLIRSDVTPESSAHVDGPLYHASPSPSRD